MKSDMKYVFVKRLEHDDIISLIEDPIALYRSGEYSEENGDQIFQLGNEVKLKISIEPTTVYRTNVNSSDIKVHSYGLKGDLGVGDYRG